MCGICGIVTVDPRRPVDEGRLLAMREALVHRGPDDAGAYLAPGVALGSRRLAILDLSPRGRMPMCTSDGRFWIVHNGEIYNYRSLRSELESRGYVFRSTGDTEVLLQLYAADGPRMLERLNGMFAFAIWDAREATLFVARDRLGIKPVYYACHDGALHFASEQKALLAAGVSLEFDPEVWPELLCFRYVAGERTPLVGIKRLLPGHYLLWKSGAIDIRRWWHLAERARALRANTPPDPVSWLQQVFDSAVSYRRISDVPIGVLLSGGLDSGSVAATLARQSQGPVASFTVRFAEAGFDEGAIAEEVASRSGLTAHSLVVPPNELAGRLLEGSWLNDEPVAHASDLHLRAISQYAKSRVTVLLSGEGADETLGGYVRYQPLRYAFAHALGRAVLPGLVSLLAVNGRLAKLSRVMQLRSTREQILFNACDVLPADLVKLGIARVPIDPFRGQILDEAAALYPGDSIRQAMYNDQHTFLPSLLHRNDRMTMGASIECRLPFLDYRLVEGLASLPSPALLAWNESKPLLRRAMAAALPRAVHRHRKWGFGVPWRSYLRNSPPLRQLMCEVPDLPQVRCGPFRAGAVRSLISGFLRDGSNAALVTQFVMIGAWLQAYLQPQRRLSLASTQLVSSGA